MSDLPTPSRTATCSVAEVALQGRLRGLLRLAIVKKLVGPSVQLASMHAGFLPAALRVPSVISVRPLPRIRGPQTGGSQIAGVRKGRS